MFETAGQALSSKAFIGQACIAFVINGAINGVIAWATMSSWGQRQETLQYPSIPVWRWSYELNSCGCLDVLLTTFFISYFSVLLGTAGVRKDVREKKCEVSGARCGSPFAVCRIPCCPSQMIETTALRVGFWRFTPVAVMNACVRAFLLGVQVSAFIGMPTLLFIWAAIGNGEAPGLNWCIFKGVWASFVALPVFVIVFLSAIDKRHFRAELEFEQLVNAGTAYEGAEGWLADLHRYSPLLSSAACVPQAEAKAILGQTRAMQPRRFSKSTPGRACRVSRPPRRACGRLRTAPVLACGTGGCVA